MSSKFAASATEQGKRSFFKMGSYQEHALEGASAIELVVALYDGILKFLHLACRAVDCGDAKGRRVAVKRALDIIIHLQARLRMDVGGKPAQVLSEFYASVFAQILQASQSASRPKFEHAIACVRNVRDAWRQVARDPKANPMLDVTASMNSDSHSMIEEGDAPSGATRWTA